MLFWMESEKAGANVHVMITFILKKLTSRDTDCTFVL